MQTQVRTVTESACRVPIARTAHENIVAEPNVVFNRSPLGAAISPPDALLVQADCAICGNRITRTFRCDGNYLLIEPWHHKVGANHPAVPRELVED